MAGFTPFTAQLALSSLLLVDILTLPQADLATALYWMPQRALVLSLSRYFIVDGFRILLPLPRRLMRR
jgi:hypothetical protein